MPDQSSLQETACSPLILPFFRIFEAFNSADDENDYFIETTEGALFYLDLSRPQEEIDAFEKEIKENSNRYFPIPKITCFETKKMMENFVTEKVVDIDNRGRLTDALDKVGGIESFKTEIEGLEYEEEKWKSYRQERIRIRSIEFLRELKMNFVFEEDAELPKSMLQKVKSSQFTSKVAPEIMAARKTLELKAKSYYLESALVSKPRRGRPPKAQVEQEIEQTYTVDIFTKIPRSATNFLYQIDIETVSGAEALAKESAATGLRGGGVTSEKASASVQHLSQKLSALKAMTMRSVERPGSETPLTSLGSTMKVMSATEQKDEGVGLFSFFKGALGAKKKASDVPKQAGKATAKKVTQIKSS